MAVPLTLKTAIGTYPHTRPLKDGSISSPRVCLDHVEVVPVNRAFRPMVNLLAYDVSEMALVTLLLGKAVNRPLVGVPVILMQQSAYGMLLVRQDSPLRDPRHLAGRSIGVRAYTQTTGVWLRGMLHDQFGLDLDGLRTIQHGARRQKSHGQRSTRWPGAESRQPDPPRALHLRAAHHTPHSHS